MMRISGFIFVLLALIAITDLASADRVTLVAGGGTGGDGGLATAARLIEPFAVGFDRAGNLYIVESEGGERVRKVDSRGVITTIAGTGERGFSGDGGPAAKARINAPHNALVQPNGDIYLADTMNNRVRRIDHRTGTITTIAGTGEKGFSGDGGQATQAQFGGIYCLALDERRNLLYLCDLDNRRIRAVDMKSGIVTTVAGNGRKGVPVNETPAIEAPLVDPRAIALDSRGQLFILERSGNALRVVGSDGKIRTLISASQGLNGPKHLWVDREDNVLIADTENHVIKKFDSRTGLVEIVAGTGKQGKGGIGGPARELELSRPHGVFARPDGTIYIADSSNGRVLKIEP